jgi:rhodanese-related sulfurtransferase
MTTIPTIDVLTYAAQRAGDASPILLDVREVDEYNHCKIDGSILIPLGQLPMRYHELPKDRPIVVHCHHGGRSARAVQFLMEKGLTCVHNLAGGIDLWSLQVDSGVPRY